jgi:hypothetical protein
LKPFSYGSDIHSDLGIMRTTSVTLYELGSILDRLTVTTSTYAGVFHIISGRHPKLGRITVVQGITDIMIMTEEVRSQEFPTRCEASGEHSQHELPLLQAA